MVIWTYILTLSLHCAKVSLHSSGRKCLYDDKAVKYLVMVRDDVEAGDEKLKELEQEMKDWGLFDTDFCLGDVFEDEEDTPGNSDSKPKKRIGDWPSVEGEESVVEYVGAYKKACLAKKALIKNTKDRLERDQSKGHEILICTILYLQVVRRTLLFMYFKLTSPFGYVAYNSSLPLVSFP